MNSIATGKECCQQLPEQGSKSFLVKYSDENLIGANWLPLGEILIKGPKSGIPGLLTHTKFEVRNVLFYITLVVICYTAIKIEYTF